jgi:hypothetical protein
LNVSIHRHGVLKQLLALVGRLGKLFPKRFVGDPGEQLSESVDVGQGLWGVELAEESHAHHHLKIITKNLPEV